MVFKGQSLLLASLFGFACLHASNGFRIDKHARGSETGSSSTEHQSLLLRSETSVGNDAAQQSLLAGDSASLDNSLQRKCNDDCQRRKREQQQREAAARAERARQEAIQRENERRAEEERQRRAEEERRRREEEERRRREAEEAERRRREAEEKKAAEEAEKKRREEEEKRKMIEEAEKIKKDHEEAGCPNQLVVSTKGDCLDAVSQSAANGCCTLCTDTIKSAEAEYNQGIAAYMGTCDLTRDDVGPDAGPGGVNTDKICSEKCQSMSMEEALLEIDYSDLEIRCFAMPQEIAPLERTATLLETLHAAWVECRKPPETTTLEPTTTTTELTTTEAYRFSPVQIWGGTRNWRLIRDSSSISAGLGVEKHEAYVTVTPPGIGMDPASLKRSSTGSVNLLNVRHAVFGGEAIRLDVEAVMQYGSHQGKGRFMKNVQLKVARNKVDFPHVLYAHVAAVEAMSHGDSTDPTASVAFLVEVKAEGRILFAIQKWKRTFKFIYWGNGHIQVYIV